MRGVETNIKTIKQIKELRQKGFSIIEITQRVNKSKSIVHKYIQGVNVLDEYKEILKIKQGGSKVRSLKKWNDAEKQAAILIKNISVKEKLLILASLYWGEGTKSEMNIINSDPKLLKVFLNCLKELNINNSQIKVTLRIYDDLNKDKVVSFWSKELGLPRDCFKNINVLDGKKKGKLVYGMCRIRVVKSEKYFKLIMSVIKQIKNLLS